MDLKLILAFCAVIISTSKALPYPRGEPLPLPRGDAYPIPRRMAQSMLRTGSHPSLNDVLSTYLQNARQQRPEPQYGYPEYQPQEAYLQGYIANRHRRAQYLNNPELQQDYPNYDDQIYIDGDGTWYDTAATEYDTNPQVPPSNNFLGGEPTEQDIALAKLMLDHMVGKYSLEDLETLEREARIEDNSERQLQSLARNGMQKKSKLPLIGFAAPRSVPRNYGSTFSSHSRVGGSSSRGDSNVLTFPPQRRGQKEEPLTVPATSIRKPIFMQRLEEAENKALKKVSKQSMFKKSTKSTTDASSQKKSDEVSTTFKPDASTSVDTPKGKETGVVEVVKVGRSSSTSGVPKPSSGSSTPFLQPAYEVFKQYIDNARMEQAKSDEEIFKSPSKRFVQDYQKDPLRDQLNNLKKSVA